MDNPPDSVQKSSVMDESSGCLVSNNNYPASADHLENLIM
jgi:hypothetical protein